LRHRIFAASCISAIRQRWFVAFGSNRPEPRCFVRRLRVAHDPADDTVAIAHVEIVITAAAILVGADKGERSGGSHVTRSCGRSQPSNIRPRNVAHGSNFKTYSFLARLGDGVKLRRYEAAPMSASNPSGHWSALALNQRMPTRTSRALRLRMMASSRGRIAPRISSYTICPL